MYEIKLDSPGSNALSTEFMLWILDELKKADNQPILLTGKKGVFSVGADLKEILTSSSDEILNFVGVMERLFDTLMKYPAPTVVAVDGHATGGGGLLFLCCDFAYCTDRDDISIGFPEVSAGVLISPTFIRQFKQLISLPILRKLLLSAELITAKQALQYGLFDGIGDNVTAMAISRLESLAILPREPYVATKIDLFSDKICQKSFEERIHQAVSTGVLKGHLSNKFDNR